MNQRKRPSPPVVKNIKRQAYAMRVAHFGPKEKRADRSNAIISKTSNGEKVKERLDDLKHSSKNKMKEFLSEDLPEPKVENGVLIFDFKKADFQDWMITSDLEDGITEFVFLRGVLSAKKYQKSLKILEEIMIVDPTAKNVNGASGGAGGTPTKKDLERALVNFECVGTKTATEVIEGKITGSSGRIKYKNKFGRVCDFQFGPCLHRHVFGLKRKGNYINDFVNEVGRRYKFFTGKVFKEKLKTDMEELLKKMKEIFVEYAGDMMVEQNISPADFFDKNIKMCLNYMSGDQEALYKDHRDPHSKFPCIMTALKSGDCGGGELFLRKFGFLADYKNGDIILLKGDQVPHSVNALVTKSHKKKKDNHSNRGYGNRGRIKIDGRLSLIFFNNK